MKLSLSDRAEIAGFAKSHPGANDAYVIAHFTKKWPKQAAEIRAVVAQVRK